jgi:putative acetyltransferase
MPSQFQLRLVAPDEPQVAALIELHIAAMHAVTPPEFAYALDGRALSAPGVRLFAAWRDDRVLAIGALSELEPGHVEIKSMRTHPDFLRQGAAARLLDFLIATARDSGYTRVSLETGTDPAYAPAVALYERAGFEPCDVLPGYAPSPHNRFLTKKLAEPV